MTHAALLDYFRQAPKFKKIRLNELRGSRFDLRVSAFMTVRCITYTSFDGQLLISHRQSKHGSLKRDRLPVIIVNRINSCDEIKHVLNYSSEERQTIQEDYSPFFEPKLTFEHFEASRQIPPVHFLYRPPLLYITMD